MSLPVMPRSPEMIAFRANKLAMLKDLYSKAPKAHEADIAFSEYARSWLSYQRPHIKPRTYSVYAGELKNHVIPHLGKVKLSTLSPQHVRAMQYAVLESAGPVAAGMPEVGNAPSFSRRSRTA